jgi:hypothetical protein
LVGAADPRAPKATSLNGEFEGVPPVAEALLNDPVRFGQRSEVAGGRCDVLLGRQGPCLSV